MIAKSAQRVAKRRVGLPTLAVGGMTLLLLSCSVTVGADAMWLTALGNSVLHERRVPQGVPFLAPQTNEWVNVPVAGEVSMALVDRLGSAGLLTLQLLAVAMVLAGLVASSKRLGASEWGSALAVFLLVLGQLPSLGVVRGQVWSLPLFVAMALLLRDQASSPNWLVWLTVPLVIVWGNLHGAALVGVAMAGAYLLLDRMRHQPMTATAVGVASVLSIWFTPAGLRSHDYYLDVLQGAAPSRGEGLWAPIDLGSGFGLLMAASTATLGGLALRRRLPVWEYAVFAGLAYMTLQAARNGIWLAMWAAPRAASAITREPTRTTSGQATTRVKLFITCSLAVPIVIGVTSRAEIVESEKSVAAQIAQLVGPDESVLATSRISEILANHGVLLWAGNPIDALPIQRQHAYLDFLKLDYEAALSDPEPPTIMVLPTDTSAPAGMHPTQKVGRYVVYRQLGQHQSRRSAKTQRAGVANSLGHRRQHARHTVAE